ncbi:class I SAM-dependent methyltransferase, partial [Prochlorococcus sp. AH-716-G10]|nr:class I SAM-dependent methyltransferase [Prochlorococcus sp. AH-716-G10]
MDINSKNKNSKKLFKCRICNSNDIVPILDLGSQPLANSLKKEKTQLESLFSLKICQCKNCSVIQLTETINSKLLFNEYVWVTGTSKIAKEYSQIFFNRSKQYLKSKNAFVVEVASNDGTFLKPFKNNGFKVLGVDPASNIAEIANREGIKTIPEFFGLQSSKAIVQKEGKANLVFARNVIPHVENIKDVINGISNLLSENGVAIIEFHRADIILDELHYDSIYHEHLFYFSLHSLTYLLNSFDLYPFDLDISPISGGSFVLYFSKDRKSKSKILIDQEKEEINLGVEKLTNWKYFSSKVIAHKKKIVKIVSDFNEAKKKVIAYGASARSSTLLNFCELSYEDLEVIADKAPMKQGLFTPGTSIPIVSPEEALRDNPDVI